MSESTVSTGEHSPSPEYSTKKESTPLRRFLGRTALVAGMVVGVNVGMVTAPHPQERPESAVSDGTAVRAIQNAAERAKEAAQLHSEEQRAQQAARTIALGKDCSVAGIKDLGTQPSDQYRSYTHDDVRITLTTKPLKEALPYLQMYENDDRVGWFYPQAIAKVDTDLRPRSIHRGSSLEAAEFAFEDPNPQGILSLPTDLPDGSHVQVHLWQETQTVTFGDNVGEHYTGQKGCTGELTKQHGKWNLDESAPKPPDSLDEELMLYR